MIKKNELVYICSPLSAPTEAEIRENMSLARFYVKMVAGEFHCRAIAPHSFLPEYLDDNIPEEREIGLQFGLSVLELSKAMVVRKQNQQRDAGRNPEGKGTADSGLCPCDTGK